MEGKKERKKPKNSSTANFQSATVLLSTSYSMYYYYILFFSIPCLPQISSIHHPLFIISHQTLYLLHSFCSTRSFNHSSSHSFSYSFIYDCDIINNLCACTWKCSNHFMIIDQLIAPQTVADKSCKKLINSPRSNMIFNLFCLFPSCCFHFILNSFCCLWSHRSILLTYLLNT